MQTFTVTLPRHKFIIYFNYEKFNAMFPNSLFIRTIDLTKESNIPIDNPVITPEVLQLLHRIINTRDIPPVSEMIIQTSFDYLGIDLPNVVYDPRYPKFKLIYPDIAYTNWDEEYSNIISLAQKHDLPELVSYLFKHTDPKNHIVEDYKIIKQILKIDYKSLDLTTIYGISPIDITIGSMILRSRLVLPNLLEFYGNIDQIHNAILDKASLDLYKAYTQASKHNITEYHLCRAIQKVETIPNKLYEYMRIIDHINTLLPEPSKLYELFIAITNNNTVMIRNLFWSTIRLYRSAISPMLYTAVLLGCGDVFTVILDIIYQINVELSDICYDWFFIEYIRYPELIVPDTLKLVISRANKKQITNAVQDFKKKGYDNLVNMLPKE